MTWLLFLLLIGAHQPEKERLTAEHFQQLQEEAKSLQGVTPEEIPYNEIYYLEGGPPLFALIKKPKMDKQAIHAALLQHFFKGPGTETAYQIHEMITHACDLLLDPRKTEVDAFMLYLKERGALIQIQDLSHPENRVLIRLAAMLGCTTKEEGKWLKDAYLALPNKEREKILWHFDPRTLRKYNTFQATPVLQNLLANPNLGSTKEVRLKKAIALALPILASILASHEQDLAKGKTLPHIPLNFQGLAEIASKNPEFLARPTFHIDEKGTVYLEKDEGGRMKDEDRGRLKRQ